MVYTLMNVQLVELDVQKCTCDHSIEPDVSNEDSHAKKSRQWSRQIHRRYTSN